MQATLTPALSRQWRETGKMCMSAPPHYAPRPRKGGEGRSEGVLLHAWPLDQRLERRRVGIHLAGGAVAGIDGMGDQRRGVAIADLAKRADAGAGERRGVLGQREIERVVGLAGGDGDE